MADPVLLYDGTCGLCHASVRFVLRHERGADFHFAPLQGDVAREIMTSGGGGGRGGDTVYVWEGGRLLDRSDAVLAVLKHLRAPWCWLSVTTIVPRSWRDALYDLVARHRTIWGTRSCSLPVSGQERRFLH